MGFGKILSKARYLSNRSAATVSPRFFDSSCWKALLKVKDLRMVGRKIKTESVNLTRVWKDYVNGLTPFSVHFPHLFDICNDQECTVDKFSDVDASSFFCR